MARTITDEEIKLSIIINGNPAQKQLLDLEKSTRALTEQKKALQIELRRTEQSLGKESQEYKNLQQAIKKVNGEIDNNKAIMKELQNQIGITGLTMKQLSDKAHLLKMTLRNLIPGSADYKRYQDELNQVNTRIGELSGRASQAGFSIGRVADGFNRYAALGASVLGFFAGMVVSVQKIIDLNGKLSDAQSNVMKTTGMTKKEVDELTKSFGVLQTRTSRIDLLGIAETGGRLGIAKEEIQDFIKVMDKASVALGDSFEGGPEVVAEKLGKIKGLYTELQDTNVEFAFNAVGSAMNDLGAAGAASEQNIADFVTRIGSMPEAFKPSIAEALALGAAFEESGLTAEIAATNYSKVITIAAGNVAGFAQVMGRSRNEIENLINTDPNEFFLQFADSIKNLKGTDLATVLDSLKLNDAQVKQVLGAAGKNVEMFREKIDLANKSIEDGTSLTNEFDIKNNNLAATLEKIKKTVSGWFSSETFVQWLTTAFHWLAKFIGATEDASGEIEGFRNKLMFFLKVMAVLITSYISYNLALRLTTGLTRTVSTAQALYNVIQQRGTVVTGFLRSSQLLLAAVYNLVTGNITRASAAMRLFNTVTKLNPLGLLLGVLGALAVAFVTFSNKNKDATKSVQDLSSQIKIQGAVQKQFEIDFANSSQKLKSKIEPLISILKDQNLSLHTRKKAYEELIKISPEFRGSVDKEYNATAKLDQVYRSLLESMAEKMRFQAMQKIMQKNYDEEAKAIEKIIKLETKKKELDTEQEKFQRSRRDNRKNVSLFMEQKEINEQLAEAYNEQNKAQLNQNQILQYRKKQIQDLELEQKKYAQGTKEWLAIQEKINALLGVSSTSNKTSSVNEVSVPILSNKKTSKKSVDKYDDSYLAETKKQQDELLKMQQQSEIERLNILEDSYGKEIALEKTKYRQKIEELNLQNVIYNMELDKLDAEIVSAEKAKDTKKATDLKKRQEVIVSKITINNENIQHEEEVHQLKLSTIQEKWAKEEITKEKENYDREKQLRETAFLEELNSLGLSEEEKIKRKEKFNQDELKFEEEFLKQLIEKLNKIVKGKKIDKIDVNLLSKEQVDYFTKEAEKLGLTLQQLIDKKNELAGKGKGTDFNILSGTGTDIFGFTPEQWEKTYSDLESTEGKLKALDGTFQGLQNAWGAFSVFLEAKDKRELQNIDRNTAARKRKLKQDLDNGIINKVQYNRAIEKLDQDKEKKIAEIEYKKAKRDRIAALANIAMNTGIGIVKAVAASPLTGGMPWTAIIGAIGALQVATVLAQPLPAKGLEEGLYPDYVKREQDGKIFRSSGTSKMETGLYSKPRILVGEGPGDMPEMVIDKRAFAQISPETKGALFRELRGIKGFENGYYKDNVFYTGASGGSGAAPIGSDLDSVKMMMALMAKNIELLDDLKSSGVIAYISKDYREMKKLQEQLDKFKALKEKSKQ